MIFARDHVYPINESFEMAGYWAHFFSADFVEEEEGFVQGSRRLDAHFG